jgi:hypothetical protein
VIPLVAAVDLFPVGAALATALLGSFVAYQSYRGYRRNASRPMLFLAVGIALLTVVPFVVKNALVFGGLVGETGGALVSQALGLVGLLAVLYSLTRA